MSLAAAVHDTVNDHETLVALDRAHLIHPVASWRQHEKRGPRVLDLGARRLADRRSRPPGARRLCRPVVRQRRLRAGKRGTGGHAAAARASLRHRLLRLRQRAGDPDRGQARRDHAAVADARVSDAWRLRGRRCGDALHRAVLELARPAAKEALHFAGARLSRLVVHRGRADRVAGVPSRLRSAAAHPALHRLAQPLPAPAGRRPAGADRRVGRSRCAPRWRSSARRGSPRSSASRSRARAA